MKEFQDGKYAIYKTKKTTWNKNQVILPVDMCPYRYAIYCDPGSDSDHWRRKSLNVLQRRYV